MLACRAPKLGKTPAPCHKSLLGNTLRKDLGVEVAGFVV